jgi:hypothetical protein
LRSFVRLGLAMKKRYIAEHVSGISIYQLPPSMSREIGRIIVYWAFFEHFIQESVWQVLSVSPADGRIAVRQPSVKDRLEMLNDLVNYERRVGTMSCTNPFFRALDWQRPNETSFLGCDQRRAQLAGEPERGGRRHHQGNRGRRLLSKVDK